MALFWNHHHLTSPSEIQLKLFLHHLKRKFLRLWLYTILEHGSWWRQVWRWPNHKEPSAKAMDPPQEPIDQDNQATSTIKPPLALLFPSIEKETEAQSSLKSIPKFFDASEDADLEVNSSLFLSKQHHLTIRCKRFISKDSRMYGTKQRQNSTSVRWYCCIPYQVKIIVNFSLLHPKCLHMWSYLLCHCISILHIQAER